MNGPHPSLVWMDELWDYYPPVPATKVTGNLQVRIRDKWQDAYSEMFDKWRELFIGPNWHAEVAAIIEVSPREDHSIPAIGNIHWVCKKPTAPLYRPGTYGWYTEEADRILRASPHYEDLLAHNRRVAAENAALYQSVMDLLGGK